MFQDYILVNDAANIITVLCLALLHALVIINWSHFDVRFNWISRSGDFFK